MKKFLAALLSFAFIAMPGASGLAYAQTEPLTTEQTEMGIGGLFALKGTATTPSEHLDEPFADVLVFDVRHGLTAEQVEQGLQAEQERIEQLKQDIVLMKRLERKRNFVDTTGFDWIYLEAEERYGVPWEILSAVHQTETNRSGDTAVTSYAGAQGPMQFIPSTWRAYGADGDGDGVANIHDVDDAIHGAANYLAANGGASGNVRNALFRYNHSTAYVNLVLSRAYAVGYQQ
ncbi:MAG: lytic transglycosylase domain-containing protein [Candidatus Doudnabacteria bacterium]|nr:lytic transglycosylase domain-containing protein [Candidatus Doudnabacteria bacterium]